MTALGFLSDLTAGLDPVKLKALVTSDRELAFSFLPEPNPPTGEDAVLESGSPERPGMIARLTGTLGDEGVTLQAPNAGSLRLLVPETFEGEDNRPPEPHLLQLRLDPAVVLPLSEALPAPYAGPSRVLWGPIDPVAVRTAMETLLASRDLEGADPSVLLERFMAGEDELRAVAGEEVGVSSGPQVRVELLDNTGFFYHPLFLFQRWHERSHLSEAHQDPLWLAADLRLREVGTVEVQGGHLIALDLNREPLLDLGPIQIAI